MNFLSWHIAWRYLRYTSKEKSISVMAKVSCIGIMIGSFALALVLAIMAGFEKETYKKMQGIHASLIMQAPYKQKLAFKQIEPILHQEFPEIISASPTDIQHVMIHDPKTDEIGSIVALKGIDPLKETATTILASKLENQSDTLDKLVHDDSVIIGCHLARQLNVTTGDFVHIYHPAQKQRSRGTVCLEQSRVRINGIFKTGIEEYDANVMIGNLTLLHELFPDSDVTSIGLNIKPNVDEKLLIQKLKNRFKLSVFSWKDMYPALVSALKLEKYASFFVLALIVLVASMTIISLLFMQITQKRSDIAILRALGASTMMIRNIFLAMGMFIALISTIAGLVLAYGASLLLQKYPFIELPDVYMVSHLPISIEWHLFALVACVVLLVSFCATLFAVGTIKRLPIADILRFEA